MHIICWEYLILHHKPLLLELPCSDPSCPHESGPALKGSKPCSLPLVPQAVAASPGVVTDELPSHFQSAGTNIPLRCPLTPFPFSFLLHFQPGAWLGQNFLKDLPDIGQMKTKNFQSLHLSIFGVDFSSGQKRHICDNERTQSQNSRLCSEAWTYFAEIFQNNSAWSGYSVKKICNLDQSKEISSCEWFQLGLQLVIGQKQIIQDMVTRWLMIFPSKS